jgi:hypothetical protein
MCFLLHFVFFCIKMVNSSDISTSIWTMCWIPNVQDPKLLALCKCSFECIIHLKYAAIDNCIHQDMNLMVTILTDWDWANWKSGGQKYYFPGWLHLIKIFIFCQMIHFVSSTSVCQWIFLWHHSPFLQNTSLNVVLGTVSVLDLAGFIGLHGNGLTPSKFDDFLSEPSLYSH